MHYKIHFLGFISLRDMLDLSSRDLGFWDDDEDIEGKEMTVIANYYSYYHLMMVVWTATQIGFFNIEALDWRLHFRLDQRFSCIKSHKKVSSIGDFYLEEIGKLDGGLIRTSAFYHKLTICPKGWNCDLYHWWDLLLGLNLHRWIRKFNYF